MHGKLCGSAALRENIRYGNRSTRLQLIDPNVELREPPNSQTASYGTLRAPYWLLMKPVGYCCLELGNGFDNQLISISKCGMSTTKERFLPIDFISHRIRIGRMNCLLDNTLLTKLVLIVVMTLNVVILDVVLITQ